MKGDEGLVWVNWMNKRGRQFGAVSLVDIRKGGLKDK